MKAEDDSPRIPTVGGALTKGGVALIVGHGIMWEHLLQSQAGVILSK